LPIRYKIVFFFRSFLKISFVNTMKPIGKYLTLVIAIAPRHACRHLPLRSFLATPAAVGCHLSSLTVPVALTAACHCDRSSPRRLVKQPTLYRRMCH
jgi:hypothetical protein